MIGKNIKRMRELRGWSQETLARKMGYKSKSTINKIEKDINDVSQTKINKFAQVFQCEPTDLMIEAYDTVIEFEAAWRRAGGKPHPNQQDDPAIVQALQDEKLRQRLISYAKFLLSEKSEDK